MLWRILQRKWCSASGSAGRWEVRGILWASSTLTSFGLTTRWSFYRRTNNSKAKLRFLKRRRSCSIFSSYQLVSFPPIFHYQRHNRVGSVRWTQPRRPLKCLVQILIMSPRTFETSFKVSPPSAGKEEGPGPLIGSATVLSLYWLLCRLWYFLRTQTVMKTGHTTTDVASFQMCGLPLTFVISLASTFIKKPFLLKGFHKLQFVTRENRKRRMPDAVAGSWAGQENREPNKGNKQWWMPHRPKAALGRTKCHRAHSYWRLPGLRVRAGQLLHPQPFGNPPPVQMNQH